MGKAATYENDLNLKATELRLGLPGTDHEQGKQTSLSSLVKSNKRSSSQMDDSSEKGDQDSAPAPK